MPDANGTLTDEEAQKLANDVPTFTEEEQKTLVEKATHAYERATEEATKKAAEKTKLTDNQTTDGDAEEAEAETPA